MVSELNKIELLVIEDDIGDFNLIRKYLKKSANYNFVIGHCTSIADALIFFNKNKPDLILLDLSLPDSTGVQGLQEISKIHPLIPCVILTGVEDDNIIDEALLKGAQEYILKENINPRMLERVIHFAIERNKLRKNLSIQNVRLKELDEMKSQFVATVSHELRTPLSSISGAISLFEDGIYGDLTKDQEDAMKLMRRNSDRLMILINDILDFSRIEAGQLEIDMRETHIPSLLKSVLTILESRALKKSCELKIDDMPERLYAYCDESKIYQVILNLVSNAISHNPNGTVIEVGARKEKDRAVIWIQDNGNGIPQAFQEKVFDRFFQYNRNEREKNAGTGLGLAICKGLVEAHEGHLKIDSEVGKGSRFTFDVSVLELEPLIAGRSLSWDLGEMKLTAFQYGDKTVIALEGMADLTTFPKFVEIGYDILDKWSTRLVVDFARCTWLMSRAIGFMMELRICAIERGGNLVFANVNPRIRKIFEEIGLMNTIPTYTDINVAMVALDSKKMKIE